MHLRTALSGIKFPAGTQKNALTAAGILAIAGAGVYAYRKYHKKGKFLVRLQGKDGKAVVYEFPNASERDKFLKSLAGTGLKPMLNAS